MSDPIPPQEDGSGPPPPAPAGSLREPELPPVPLGMRLEPINRVGFGCLFYLFIWGGIIVLGPDGFDGRLSLFLVFALPFILAIIPATRRIGLGMLLMLGAGILLLLAICGGILSNTHF